ncbi:MAG: ribbon-helix-helix domain-containing protein [Gammaproteobacteria bacterium]|nr:ribbon-helix-helix domain-containing protein [Gammaproteobacteria bacterium]
MITLRLDPKLEKTINHTAQRLGVSKSELVRKSLTEFFDKLERPSPWELGRELFGKYASGQDNLSQDRKVLIKNKIRSKK